MVKDKRHFTVKVEGSVLEGSEHVIDLTVLLNHSGAFDQSLSL